MTAMDQREDEVAACCMLRGRERATALADGDTIAMVRVYRCPGGHQHPGGHPRRHPLQPEHPRGHGHPNKHRHLSLGCHLHRCLCSARAAATAPSVQSGTQGYEGPTNRVHVEGTFFCKNAAENAAKQRSSWANSRANPPDDYSDFLISTETSVLMKCTEVKQPWKCQRKGERPPNRH